LVLVGGRALPLPHFFARWEVLQPILDRTALAEVLDLADSVVRRRVAAGAMPIILRKNRGRQLLEALVGVPILLMVDLAGLGISALIATKLFGSGGAGLLVSFIVFLALVVWNILGILRWQRRSLALVEVHCDRIEVTARRATNVIAFADVASVEVVKLRGRRFCSFNFEDGTARLVDAYAASFAHLYPRLRDTLFLKLAANLDGQLTDGKSISVCDSKMFWRRRSATQRAIVIDKLLNDQKAAELVEHRARGLRGSFTITAVGLKTSPDDDHLIAWSEVGYFEADEAGIMILTSHGRWSASVEAENCLPVMTWLQTLPRLANLA
jgi:hypothetical protein